MVDKIARKVVQLSFLALFLYPFVPTLHGRLTYGEVPVVTSWLLPWDPLLTLSRLPRLGQEVLYVGAPLLLAALTWVTGRTFCGWVCPLGTLTDLVRPLFLWRWRRRRPAGAPRLLCAPWGNSYVKYLVLLAALVMSFSSLKLIGLVDPLVVFHRAATVVAEDFLELGRRGFDLYLAVSFLFLGILILEAAGPRFWCRHLCPLGALLGWLSRWSLLNRRVSAACNHCGRCREACVMNAIPREAHDTNYQECHFCLACERACPEKAVSFGFGPLAWAQWKAKPAQTRSLHQLRYQRALAWVGGRLRRKPQDDSTGGPPVKRYPKGHVYPGLYVPAQRSGVERVLGLKIGRRGMLGGALFGVASLALWPAWRRAPARGLIRPPGALPEEEFLATCILCQECIRVCPTRGLKPALLEGGLRAVGTPHLVPLAGACQLMRGCDNLCARVCPVNAIQIIPREKMRLGLAKVEPRLCLAWDQGLRCMVCAEACPTEAAVARQGRLTVNPLKCTGCGICERSCPVVGSAIHVTLENEVRYRRGEID